MRENRHKLNKRKKERDTQLNPIRTSHLSFSQSNLHNKEIIIKKKNCRPTQPWLTEPEPEVAAVHADRS